MFGGNTLHNADNIFIMQWNVGPLIDEIIVNMSSCLLSVAMVTMIGIVTMDRVCCVLPSVL